MTLAVWRKRVSRYIDYFPKINFLSKPRSKTKTSPGIRRGDIFVLKFYSDAFDVLVHCSAALPAVPAGSIQGKHLLSTSVAGVSPIAPAAYKYHLSSIFFSLFSLLMGRGKIEW